MTFKVTMWELDGTVGNPDAQSLRDYPLATTDTLPHALGILRDREAEIAAYAGDARQRVTGGGGTEYVRRIVCRGNPYGYGDVYRTTWLSIS